MQAILSRIDVPNALQLLAAAGGNRTAELSKYPAELVLEDLDEKDDSKSPVYDSFYNVGWSPTITQMTTFSPQDIMRLRNYIIQNTLSHWNVKCGRKCPYGTRDTFFMLLAVLKHDENWEVLARMF